MSLAIAKRQQAAAYRGLADGLDAEASALDAAAAPTSPAPAVLYCRVGQYAERVALSESTVWGLVKRGLPVVGSGRARRVDVARADRWLAEQSMQVDNAVERDARSRARAAAKRVAL